MSGLSFENVHTTVLILKPSIGLGVANTLNINGFIAYV